MKKVMTGGLVALLLAALVGLLSMASIGSAAPTDRQYKKSVLTLSVSGGVGGYYMFVQGAGYTPGPPGPTGTFTLTCRKGTTCADAPDGWPPAWGTVTDFVSSDGTFSWYPGRVFSCPSNVKSAIATDTNGVKSNSVKAPC